MMLKLKQIYKKFLTILLSRFKKPQEKIPQWIKDRREKCKSCEWNTLNIEKLPLKKRLIKALSDFYSYITNKQEEDILGNCSACSMCSIYFKTEEEVEYCPKNKWDK